MGVSGVGLSLRQAANNNANGIATRTLTADGKLIAAEVSRLGFRFRSSSFKHMT